MKPELPLDSYVRKIILVSIISLCFQEFLAAQDTTFVEIRNIPPEGLLLNRGWKYKLGDNPGYANKDYNDRDWQTIDPTPDIHQLPILWKDSIVWFRLRLNVDAANVGDLAMAVTHAGASEIYLNGRLIKRFGVVSQIADEILARNPNGKPVSFPVEDPGINILAVRYTLEPNIRYTTEWANFNPGLSIWLNSFENANLVYHDNRISLDKSNSFRIAAYVILAILYFAFYISDRRQKISLYFFVYAVLWAIIWSFFYFMVALQPPARYIYFLSNLNLALQVIGWFFCLSAIYALLKQKKNWVFNALSLFGVICIPLGMFIYGWGWTIYAIGFITLMNLEITRIAIRAGSRRSKGAWIMVVGAMLSLGTWILFTFLTNTNFPGIINPWIIFSLNHLTIPVAVSIYLGYDFALTNRSLEQKLVEIKTLSEEKNQILSSQNEMLEKQVSERTSELKQSLNDLKAAQSQLIQSEKMASLGELTAGIAHEIQNPLNFVNNFSEVNKDLLAEMSDEIDKGNIGEAKQLAKNVIDNHDKINHHGKRADAIVKGMLQHTRTGSGQKEPTDINALCDEYLRLAYHGLRAKDKNFNAAIETDFDNAIGKIDLIPHEIGRAILNMINNAFYAVKEKEKRLAAIGQGGSPARPNDSVGQAAGRDYEPKVVIRSKKLGDEMEIRIKDNGIGIPQKVWGKILQPFFTTKPTGQGTGLGLSLAYDIITNGHGGELAFVTEEGEGTEFIIRLPYKG